MTPEERFERIERNLEAVSANVGKIGTQFWGFQYMISRADNRMADHDALIKALIESQLRTEAKLEKLAEAQWETDASLKRLSAAQQETDASLKKLSAAQQETDASLKRLSAAQEKRDASAGRMEAAVADLAATVKSFIESNNKR